MLSSEYGKTVSKEGGGSGGETEAVSAAGYKSLITSDAKANKTNIFTEENFYILHWLHRIRRASCARGLRIGFLQPDFLCVIYGPMMHNKKLWRTNEDIKIAVNLWCSNVVAAEELYGHISEWDASSVTDMSGLFCNKKMFNDDISRWDVSHVTNMSCMFYQAASFNQTIGDWNVYHVTDMSCMFSGARVFNQPIRDWDVSNVTTMAFMFSGAYSFNQPVGDWNVSKVTYMDDMFSDAREFNQDLTKWDMRSVTLKGKMFSDAHAMQRDNKPAAVWDDPDDEVHSDALD